MGHPGYRRELVGRLLCLAGFHRDTVTNDVGGHYCGRCSRPNPEDMQRGLI